jgi:hypothetical protein
MPEPEFNEDLWPADLDLKPMVSPATILRVQASLLGSKTQGLVQAAVETKMPPAGVTPITIHHTFFLVVPPLGNYRYSLFSVHHTAEAFYPVFVDETPVEPEPKSAFSAIGEISLSLLTVNGLQDENFFRMWLRETLASNATRRIIANFYLQANAQ